MAYIIEVWGIKENDEKFNETFKSKSTKQKNWIPKMREKFGKKINFDNLKDFGYRYHNSI